MPFRSSHPTGTSRASNGSSGAAGIGPAPRGMADWLSLAAAPTFAIMALFTAVTGGADMICSSAQEPLPLTGMAAMYLLMAVFHSAPWLRLVSSRRSEVGRS